MIPKVLTQCPHCKTADTVLTKSSTPGAPLNFECSKCYRKWQVSAEELEAARLKQLLSPPQKSRG